MVFYGASGHAKVIIEGFVQGGGQVTGILDDNISIRKLLEYPVSGRYMPHKYSGAPFIISIGDNTIRKRIAGSIDEQFGNVIHPGSVISASSMLGRGTAVMAGVIVNAACSIGEHVILNTGAIIDHDTVIEDFVHISPNATICGGVHIGEGTHVGAGATVIQNIRIGKWVTLGAGTVVIEDVPDYAVVAGVPGKVKGFNSGAS